MRANKKIRLAALVMGVCALLLTGCGKGKGDAMAFADKLGSGINLGNSLDATGLRAYVPDADDLEYETFWNNPVITKEQIAAIKAAGFHTLRLPVTWEDHMDADGTVSEVWMQRVEDVAAMAVEQDLYVILDTHHEDWLNLETEHENEISDRLAALWQQIAERFIAYDEHLLFEGMNEPRERDTEHEWDEGTEENRAFVNRLNRVFVDTVRNTGGNNAERYLLISPYASCTKESALEDLEILGEHVLVSVHIYEPYDFCQNETGTAEWSESSMADTGEISETFAMLDRLFLKNGIPVIVTEYGCKDKGNEEQRLAWITYYKEQAKQYGIKLIWWDDGADYALFDREQVQWKDTALLQKAAE